MVQIFATGIRYFNAYGSRRYLFANKTITIMWLMR